MHCLRSVCTISLAYKTRRLYCVEWTQYSIRPKRSAICNRCFPRPTKVLDANGISIASSVFAWLARWQTDWQTDRPRYSLSNNRRSAQWRSQILLLSTATTSIYWSSRLICKRSPHCATTNWGTGHPIAAFYLSIDLEGMKDWVGLVGWPICRVGWKRRMRKNENEKWRSGKCRRVPGWMCYGKRKK